MKWWGDISHKELRGGASSAVVCSKDQRLFWHVLALFTVVAEPAQSAAAQQAFPWDSTSFQVGRTTVDWQASASCRHHCEPFPQLSEWVFHLMGGHCYLFFCWQPKRQHGSLFENVPYLFKSSSRTIIWIDLQFSESRVIFITIALDSAWSNIHVVGLKWFSVQFLHTAALIAIVMSFVCIQGNPRPPCKVPTAHQEQFGIQHLAQGHFDMELSSALSSDLNQQLSND